MKDVALFTAIALGVLSYGCSDDKDYETTRSQSLYGEESGHAAALMGGTHIHQELKTFSGQSSASGFAECPFDTGCAQKLALVGHPPNDYCDGQCGHGADYDENDDDQPEGHRPAMRDAYLHAETIALMSSNQYEKNLYSQGWKIRRQDYKGGGGVFSKATYSPDPPQKDVFGNYETTATVTCTYQVTYFYEWVK